MPSSSSSSRISARSGVSPSCTFPPGNSQRPAIGWPGARCANSTRPSASISATAVTRTTGFASAAVTAVDIDVAMRQIASPHGGPAGTKTEIDRDMDFAALHVLADRPLAIARHRTTLGGNLDTAHRDRQPVALGLLAGLASAPLFPAPRGFCRRDRDMDQGPVPDLPAGPPALPSVLAARGGRRQ